MPLKGESSKIKQCVAACFPHRIGPGGNDDIFHLSTLFYVSTGGALVDSEQLRSKKLYGQCWNWVDRME